jgi:hypothetical protein
MFATTTMMGTGTGWVLLLATTYNTTGSKEHQSSAPPGGGAPHEQNGRSCAHGDISFTYD